MNFLLLTISQVGLSLLRNGLSSGESGVDVAAELIRIIQAAEEAYQEHTGEPLDWRKLPRKEHVEPPSR